MILNSPPNMRIFHFVAWLLLLLISISTPTVNSLYFFSLNSSVPGSISIKGVNVTTAGTVRFGAYGYCIPLVPEGNNSSLYCSSGSVGHTFDDTVQSALGVSGIQDVYAASSSKAMVLNPLSCAFVFLDMVSNDASISILLLTTATSLFDIISTTILRSEVERVTGGIVKVSYGPCTWLAICTLVFLWIFYVLCIAVVIATLSVYVNLILDEFRESEDGKISNGIESV